MPNGEPIAQVGDNVANGRNLAGLYDSRSFIGLARAAQKSLDITFGWSGPLRSPFLDELHL